MPYLEEECQEIVGLYEHGMGIVEISRKLHHDAGCISQALRDAGIWIRGSRNFTDSEEAEIAKIYQVGGFSTRTIARAYGLSHHISICAALKRQGVEQRPKAERNRLYNLDPHVFDVIDAEDKAYWLGFLYADANTYRRSLIIGLKASDVSQLKKFRRFMKSESPIKHVEKKANDKMYPTVTIEHTDRHLVLRVRELGIVKGRGAFEKTVDEIPSELVSHFIRGYFDGDGSAHKHGSLSFCGQKDILKWIRAIMTKEAGTNPNLSIRKHKHANAFYLVFSGRIQALNVARYFYRDATIWLARKRNVINSWPEPKPRLRNEKGQFI